MRGGPKNWKIYGGFKRKEREKYPAIPCTEAELQAILYQWLRDGLIQPFKPRKPPTEEEKNHPRFCRYHQYIGHPTTLCQILRKMITVKIDNGTLEIMPRKQGIDKDLLPRHKGKE